MATAPLPPPLHLHGDIPPPPSSPQRSAASIAGSSSDPRHIQLISASGQANESRVREIFADDPNWTSPHDRHALRQALQRVAARGNVPVARLLLTKGAGIEPRSESEIPALYKATEAGHHDFVAQLLEHGANPDVTVPSRLDQTPLFIACFRGHNTIVELLLAKKASVEARDKKGRTPLLYLAANRDGAKWTTATLELLLGPGGANREAVDDTGRTPLLWAATYGSQKMTESLLNSSLGGEIANVKATNHRGRTALHLAAEEDYKDIVRLLLKNGADPNTISDGGWTALHNAAQNGHHEVVEQLLLQKADINAQLSNGMTPLHWAAFGGHKTVVEHLLNQKKTELDLKDSFDRTPMLCAAAGAHAEIVRMLSPQRTAYRLSEAARMACEECKATVVDFGNFRDGKKLLVKRPSVYDVLYGSEPTRVQSIKFQPDFRWIHLPANNIAWAEALLSKWFIEGGHTEVEDFKSLEKCFYQEHRGPFAHANYMRTYCDRFPAFRDEESSSSGLENIDEHSPALPDEPSSLGTVPTVIYSREGNGIGDIDTGPASPKRFGAQFEDGSFHGRVREGREGREPGSRKKGKGEQIAERHPTRKPRARGPPGNPPGTKALKFAEKLAARSSASPMPSEALKLPKLDGKIVLFMPYLHFETDERRQRMSQVIHLVRDNDENPIPEGLGPTRDIMLARGYLHARPPLHPRRTLDQFFYRGIDTAIRDTDQVVYRYCMRHKLEKKVFMVDQLWLWVLGDNLVITCFPQRWDQPSHDPFNIMDGIIDEINAKTRAPLRSVYDLAMMITSRCSGMFYRHQLADQSYQFLDMFESSIGLVTNTESELFSHFNKASERSAQWLSQYTSTPRRRHLSALMSPHPSAFTLDSGKVADDDDSTLSTSAEFSDALLDIGTETALLAEIKDIRDELNILNGLLSAQKSTLARFADNIREELTSGIDSGAGTRAYADEIRKRSGDQLRLLETHCYDIERMDKQAESIYVSLTHLLDLKQKHSNALEARYARINAAFAARQGQTVLIFTIVTILFLPMSFIASFFSIQLNDLQERLYVGYVSKYIFGIGLGISIPLIIMAFTARDIFDAAHGVYAAVKKSGDVLSWATGKNKARQGMRLAPGGMDGAPTVAVTGVTGPARHLFGSHSGAHDDVRNSHSRSRYGSVNNDGQDQLMRLSLHAPRQPHLQSSSLSQHQLQNPPRWMLTAGNSTMRIRNHAVAPNPGSHGEPRGDVGAAGGFAYMRNANYSFSSSRPSKDLEMGMHDS